MPREMQKADLIQVHADSHCADGTAVVTERDNVLEPCVERA